VHHWTCHSRQKEVRDSQYGADMLAEQEHSGTQQMSTEKTSQIPIPSAMRIRRNAAKVGLFEGLDK
jgi:hypothetical protein